MQLVINDVRLAWVTILDTLTKLAPSILGPRPYIRALERSGASDPPRLSRLDRLAAPPSARRRAGRWELKGCPPGARDRRLVIRLRQQPVVA